MRQRRRILGVLALLALFAWYANSAPVPKDASPLPLMASTFGADPAGATDATTALNNCLTAAGSGGICAIDRGAVLKLLGNTRIPAHTTLDCQQTFPDAEDGDHLPDYRSMPALKLDSGHTIQAGGIAAQIQNCLVYRDGMTFPAADASAFAGTAISAEGNNNFTALNIEVIGFNTCVDVHGTLRYDLRKLYLDCSGAANAALFIGNSGDAGYIDQVKIQPIATGNGSCTASLRSGTGFLSQNSGGDFIGTIISQNFQRAQFTFENSDANMTRLLWADYLVTCPRGRSIGVKMNRASGNSVAQLNLNSMEDGLLIEGNGPEASNYFGDVFLNTIARDGVVVGTSTPSHAGVVAIGNLRTNVSADNVGRYAVNFADSVPASRVLIGHCTLFGVNGRSSPYISNAAGSVGNQLQIPACVTDLAAGNALIGGPSTAQPATVASAPALPIPQGGARFLATGNTTIISLSGVYDGLSFDLIFSSVLTLRNGNNIRLAKGTNLTTTSGTFIHFQCYMSGLGVVCAGVPV